MNSSISYEKLDPISHIHKRPDMYIGSLIKRIQRNEYTHDNHSIVETPELEYSDGLLRIFVEALSNAIDNVWRTRSKQRKCSSIKVTVDSEETSLWNDGLCIPVEMHPTEHIYCPELIFGHLLSSSNYNDQEERFTSGRNGLGIKLLNVFSKWFQVEIVDDERKLYYCQTWTNNMREKSQPIVKSSSKKGYTMIRWKPDFEKFQMQQYDSVISNLYKKYCMDASMITQLSVFFNGEKLQYRSLTDYLGLYQTTNEWIVWETTSSSESIPPTRYAIGASLQGEYREIGFINGVYTKDGGVHLENISNELWKALMARWNKDKEKPQVTSKDLKPYFFIFVNAWAPNPEFSSQSKTKLLSPSFHDKIESKFIDKIMKWSFVEKIKASMQQKEWNQLKKVEKKKGFQRIEGLDHANLIRTKHSLDCTLILCEGLSAKTFATKGIAIGWNGKKGRDYFGIYALRGKLLNVRNASISSISQNKEITDMITALNLQSNYDYTQEEAYRTLYYGKVLILTDADEDGHHICSLILNFFHKMYPSLLRRNPSFLWCMMTPIAKIFHDSKTMICYYNEYEYQRALQQHSKPPKIKYYKGLGTSSDQEIRDTFGQKMIGFQYDSFSDQAMNKAFHKVLSNDRKNWLSDYDPEQYKIPTDSYNISDYIDQELIKFSIEDCKRSIPNVFDGFKHSQRKILYSVFKKRLSHNGKSMKVAQLAGYCAEVSNYHHGEQCLYETITKMCQTFPGSLNIPYLEKDGQFGSRTYLGKDAANARYIFTKCTPLTRLLFPEIDDSLLPPLYDDGELVEPEHYCPILPTILVNGCVAGIGTGWSCSVPNFKVTDLIQSVREWLVTTSSSQHVFELNIIPYYHGFTGVIEQVGANKYISYGKIQPITVKNKTLYEITEIPIHMSTNKLKEDLEMLYEQKKIKSLKNYSTPDTVHFIIEPSDDFVPSIETLKLKSTISSTNMVLFVNETKLVKFDTISDIFELFCQKRLQLYKKRKEYLCQELESQILILSNQYRFIDAILKEKIVIFNKTESDIITTLEQYPFDKDQRSSTASPNYDYLLQMSFRQMSKERITELQAKVATKESELQSLLQTSEQEMWLQDLETFETAYRKLYHILS